MLEKLRIHKFKILSGMLGVLVFAGAVFGAYKLGQKQVKLGPRPTPTPSVSSIPTDWEIYRNETYGYEIHYPPEYVVVEGICQDDNQKQIPECLHQVFFRSQEQIETQATPVTSEFSIEVFNNGAHLSAEEWLRKHEPPESLEGTEIKPYSLAGVEGVHSFLEFLIFPNEFVYLPKGEYIFKFTLATEYSSQILSSFKFLEDSAYKCVEESSLNCAQEIELSFQCTEEYQTWARENCPGWKKYVYCEDPRPQVCTMECIQNPPYICGSDGKSYCNVCGACADPEVEWYIIQNTPCKP